MKQRKTVIVAFLLAAVLLLGVGYAALTDQLTLSGTAGVLVTDAAQDFDADIYFSKVISGTGCTAEILADPDTGKITVTSGALKAAGNEVIATYTIKSESDLDVTVKQPAITNNNTEHFEVVTSWNGDQTLAAGSTIDVTVTVKLIKTADTDENVEFGLTFDVESIN